MSFIPKWASVAYWYLAHRREATLRVLMVLGLVALAVLIVVTSGDH